MKNLLVIVFAASLVFTAFAQDKSATSPVSNSPDGQKLVEWMRTLNICEVGYRMESGKYFTSSELSSAQNTKHNGCQDLKQLAPDAIAPYVLRLTVSADGQHYQVAIKRPSDMKDKSTWCHPAVFSDDSGLIDIGINIGCPGSKEIGSTSSSK